MVETWNLDNDKYHQYGYTINEIAQECALSVSSSLHALGATKGKRYTNLRRVMGGKTGECWQLTQDGRDYLKANSLVS